MIALALFLVVIGALVNRVHAAGEVSNEASFATSDPMGFAMPEQPLQPAECAPALMLNENRTASVGAPTD